MLSKFNKMLSQKRRRLDEAGNFQVDCASYCYRYCTSNCHRRKFNNTCLDVIQSSNDKVNELSEKIEELTKKNELNNRILNKQITDMKNKERELCNRVNILRRIKRDLTNEIRRRRVMTTCGDNGGITEEGYKCKRTRFLDNNGRCHHHTFL